MFAVTVQFKVPARHRAKFEELVLKNAAVSLQEAGCRRFDVCSSEDGQDYFLYELYDDRGAFDKHLETAHFKEFDKIAPEIELEKSAQSYILLSNSYAG